jgi:hypothetical protein
MELKSHQRWLPIFDRICYCLKGGVGDTCVEEGLTMPDNVSISLIIKSLFWRFFSGIFFWFSVLRAFFFRAKLRDVILTTDDPVFKPNYWRNSSVYIDHLQRFQRSRRHDLGAAIFLEGMVRVNPLGSLQLAAEYLSEDLRNWPLEKAGLRMVLVQMYRIFLLRARAEGRDETPILEAIEKISKA